MTNNIITISKEAYQQNIPWWLYILDTKYPKLHKIIITKFHLHDDVRYALQFVNGNAIIEERKTYELKDLTNIYYGYDYLSPDIFYSYHKTICKIIDKNTFRHLTILFPHIGKKLLDISKRYD